MASADYHEIYHGCPHRSIDHRDMEDKLCRFLFAQHESEAAKVHPFLPCVGGLAAAVVQINGLFIESKTYLRSYVISLHADRSLRGNICQVSHFIKVSVLLQVALENF